MSKAEKLQKKIDDLLGKVRQLKKDNNLEGVDAQTRENNINKRYKMAREISSLQKELYVEREIENEEQRSSLEKEYSFLRHSRGDLKFRSTSWDDPLDFDTYQPTPSEIRVRDNLIWQRYNEPGSLSSEQLLYSYRKFLGERLSLRYIASGLKQAGFLSRQQIDFLSEYQQRAIEGITTDSDVSAGGTTGAGYLIPTDSEVSIYHRMMRAGPFAGPMSELGNWINFSSGAARLFAIDNSSGHPHDDNDETLIAEPLIEGRDSEVKKANWVGGRIKTENYSFLMPYTVQLDDASAGNLEQTLVFILSQAFGKGINRDVIGGLPDGPFFSLLDDESTISNKSPFIQKETITQKVTTAYNTDNEFIPKLLKSLRDMKFKLDSYYRNNASFVVSDEFAEELEGLLDEDNRYIFPNYDENGRLLVKNIPVYPSATSSPFHGSSLSGFLSYAEGDVIGFLGDWDNYLLAYVRGLSAVVLNEIFMKSLQKGILGYMRVGGGVAFDQRAFCKLQFASS